MRTRSHGERAVMAVSLVMIVGAGTLAVACEPIRVGSGVAGDRAVTARLGPSAPAVPQRAPAGTVAAAAPPSASQGTGDFDPPSTPTGEPTPSDPMRPAAAAASAGPAASATSSGRTGACYYRETDDHYLLVSIERGHVVDIVYGHPDFEFGDVRGPLRHQGHLITMQGNPTSDLLAEGSTVELAMMGMHDESAAAEVTLRGEKLEVRLSRETVLLACTWE